LLFGNDLAFKFKVMKKTLESGPSPVNVISDKFVKNDIRWGIGYDYDGARAAYSPINLREKVGKMAGFGVGGGANRNDRGGADADARWIRQ
jgi:hypothetical protein